MMAIRIETVPCALFRMRFFRFGKPGAQPFVLLPGLSVKPVADSADAVAAAYGDIAAQFEVFVFERRDDLPEEYTVDEMARDTAAAMDALGIRSAVVMGVSQGGMIAQCLALKRPGLVGALVLCSTAAAVKGTGERVLQTWISLAEQGDAAALMRAFAETIYTDAFYARYQTAFARLAQTVTAGELERFVRLAKGTPGFNVEQRLSAVFCPALVVGAKGDRVFGPEPSEDLAEALNARLILYDDYGHAVYDEAPDLHAHILAFLGKAQ